MDLGSINPVLLVASLMVSATPILLAAIGEMVVEKAGVLNLGVEGMMITGAVIGFAVAVTTGSPLLGFVAAAAASAVLSLSFGILTQFLMSNQVATGLGLTLVGLGLSSLIGKPYEGMKSPTLPKLDIPVLSDIPVLGEMLFSHDIIVYVSLLLVVAVALFLKYTRAGLILRAVGESHDSAHALGYKVIRIRLVAILFGGACAGLGGAYLSLVRVPQWTEGMTAGAGWIALAIVVFASWRAGRVLIGAYLFGGLTVLQLNLQAAGIPLLVILPYLLALVGVAAVLVLALKLAQGGSVPMRSWAIGPGSFFGLAIVAAVIGALSGYTAQFDVLFLSASPYLITILVLVVISARERQGAPAALARPFHATS